MKLAGYVTMAGPQPQPMGMGGGMSPMGMGGGMMNPMMMRNPAMSHAMAQSMSQGMRLPFQGMGGAGMPPGFGQAMGQGMGQGMGPGMGQGMGQMGQMGPGMGGMSGMNPGAMGPAGLAALAGIGGPGMGGSPMAGMGNMSPALQQLIGSTFGANGQKPGQTAGSQPSASATTPQRSRFLSRLNPLNLFRRLRSRKAEKENKRRSLLVADSVRRPNWFRRRSDDGPVEMVHLNASELQAEDIQTAANNQYPIAGPFAFGGRRQPFRPQPGPVHFPTSRRGRRIQTGNRGPFGAESRPMGLMGSGNFEVIRGGVLPAGGHQPQPQHQGQGPSAESQNRNRNADSAEDFEGDGDERGLFSTLDDDFFSAGSPGILGFQGFNHFASGASVYNSLSASNQKSSELASPSTQNQTTDKLPLKEASSSPASPTSSSSSASPSSSPPVSKANP